MNLYLLLLFNIIQIILLVILGLSLLYIFLFSMAGLLYQQKPYPETMVKRKIAVLIPGYKEDEVIVEVAEEVLLQNYPKDRFDVIIIADSFQPETIAKLKQLQVIVIEVSFEKSTKAKALNKAMELLDDSYDLAIVLDADNIMAADFLSKMNSTFEKGWTVVQGHRTAKNLNTSWAILDAISEEINNHIFRKGHRVLGLSAAIIGSGMAFRYPFFKELMRPVKAIGGFDKEIELKLTSAGHTVEYLNNAMVFDEKVQNSEVFRHQRRRWLSAQFHYFRQDIFKAIKALFTKGNVDYFNKTIQFIQPPRIILLGQVLFFSVVYFIFNLFLHNDPVYSIFWVLMLFFTFLTFLFAVPSSFYNKNTLKALISLPKGMILMLDSLLKIKGANKQFIHTKHTSSKTN
ncbi:MAG: glycosyltransferase family 2 protein [Prolixibacteraceae bacterium]